ncbi:unnamed protein product, partial [Effrenium voratum]
MTRRNSQWKPRSSKAAWNPQTPEGYETTVVLTGLPRTLNADILLGLLDEKFQYCYNYFYLPMDMDKFENTGLAYINFRSPANAVECQHYFQGFTNWGGGHRSERSCAAQWSTIQGYDAANIEKQRKLNWAASNIPEDCKPMVFDPQGTRLPTTYIFPPEAVKLEPKGWMEAKAKGGNSWTDEWYGEEWYGENTSETGNPKSRWNDRWGNKDEPWWRYGTDTRWRQEETSYWTSGATRMSRGGAMKLTLAGDRRNQATGGSGATRATGAEAAEDPQIDGDPGEAAVLALKPTVDEMVKKAEEAGDQPKLLPPPQRKPKGGGPEEPVASLGVARYACPECSKDAISSFRTSRSLHHNFVRLHAIRTCFAKWSACQHHVLSE